jgi:phenylacetate-CoA ligase
LHERAAARLVYPLAVFLRGETGVFRTYRELRKAQWLTPDELRRRQERALVDLVRLAQARSRHYRNHLPDVSRLTPETVRSWMGNVPLLTKNDLQHRADELRVSPPPSRVRSKTTGGSTGQAVTVLKDGRAIAHEMAASRMAYDWWGIQAGDRGARFWGSPHGAGRRLRFAAADLAMNRIRFSAFAFSEADLQQYWQRCLRFKPRYLYGYVSMLEEFARYVRDSGFDGRTLQLKAVVTTSEVLQEQQRSLLREVFGAPVRNEYGCGEVGPIAYECERSSLHAMTENLVIEIIRPDGQPAAIGESGEVVVTDLNNRAMPLIRYALADQGVWGEHCSCGRGFPVLDKIWGRAYDFVETPSRQRFHGEFAMYFIEDLRHHGFDVRGFQLIQRTIDSVELKLILPDSYGSDVDADIARRLRDRLPGMDVVVTRVAAIERSPSGKMRLIVNDWRRSTDAPSA